MAYLGENFTVANDGTVPKALPVDRIPADYGMATLAPADYYGAASLPYETPLPSGDDPCKNCPPKILYKTVIKEVKVPVPVPGPTVFRDRIVYVDRQTGQEVQAGGFEAGSGGGFYNTPGFTTKPSGTEELPDEEIAVEDGTPEIKTVKSFPWWILAIGVGIFLMKK